MSNSARDRPTVASCGRQLRETNSSCCSALTRRGSTSMERTARGAFAMISIRSNAFEQHWRSCAIWFSRLLDFPLADATNGRRQPFFTGLVVTLFPPQREQHRSPAAAVGRRRSIVARPRRDRRGIGSGFALVSPRRRGSTGRVSIPIESAQSSVRDVRGAHRRDRADRCHARRPRHRPKL